MSLSRPAPETRRSDRASRRLPGAAAHGRALRRAQDEGLNGEIERRTEVIGIFPDEAAIIRLVGAILLERNDEWAVPHGRTTTLESIAPSAMIPSPVCPPWQPDRSGRR